jgi:oligopeptide transport system ATP-binding protein
MKQLETCPPVQAAEYVPVAGDFAQLEQADIATDTNYASQGYWKGVATHFVRNKRAMIGLILVLLMIFLAFVAPLFSGYAYDEIVTALNAKGRKKAAVGISPRVPAIHEMVTGEPYDDIYADKTFLFGTNAGVVHAIRGINLDLQKGETVAIVGESGSGKSVTMKAAVGLLDSNATINSGEILYTYDDGHGQDKTVDLLKLSKKQLRTEYNGQRLAMVFQDPMTSLDPTMTIGKQIMEGMLLHKHMPKDEARTKALQLLELVGITDAEKRFRNYPHQLSGGMRQRVVIAIALSAEPDILICDEPTTALDVTIQSKILDLIKQIQQKMHLSVIYITHDLGVVAKVADYVNVMYAGKIVEVGNVEEIFYEPCHPYTWGLLSAMPDLETADDRLYSIPGSPPNLLHEPVGDAFAARNRFAMVIDKKAEPPLFKVSETHYAATWLLHPDAPAFEMPKELKERLERAKKEAAKYL